MSEFSPSCCRSVTDATPYRLVTTDGVSTFETPEGTFLKVEPTAIRRLTAEAMHDIAHFLRPGHLQQLAQHPRRPGGQRQRPVRRPRPAEERGDRRRRRAADVPGHRHRDRQGQEGPVRVHRRRRRGRDRRRASATRTSPRNLRYSQMAPLTMYDEVNTGTNLPAEIKIAATDGDEYKFLFMAKGGGQRQQELPVPGDQGVAQQGHVAAVDLREDPDARHRRLPAVPPRDRDRRNVGRARARDRQAGIGAATSTACPPRARRSATASATSSSSRRCCASPRPTGIGAQFGGKYFCHDVRIVRLPRHGASCPVAIAVSCSADRQALGKITADGVFLEQLERDPARFLPETTDDDLEGSDVVHIDLNRPMARSAPSSREHPVRTRVMLTGPMVVARDIAHAKIKERLDAGEPMPQYLHDHCVYYAGPAKTPEGYASGSFGPTTAGRMDAYVDQFQEAGGSYVMLAKGNRSKAVTDACRATAASTSARSAARRRAWRRTASSRSTCSSTPSSAWRRCGRSTSSTSRRSSSSTTRATTSSSRCGPRPPNARVTRGDPLTRDRVAAQSVLSSPDGRSNSDGSTHEVGVEVLADHVAGRRS